MEHALLSWLAPVAFTVQKDAAADLAKAAEEAADRAVKRSAGSIGHWVGFVTGLLGAVAGAVFAWGILKGGNDVYHNETEARINRVQATSDATALKNAYLEGQVDILLKLYIATREGK